MVRCICIITFTNKFLVDWLSFGVRIPSVVSKETPGLFLILTRYIKILPLFDYTIGCGLPSNLLLPNGARGCKVRKDGREGGKANEQGKRNGKQV